MTGPSTGALVISLDFELHWGLRDKTSTTGYYRQNLLGARDATPRMLALFEEYGVSATWATVGFLFAHSKQELQSFSPTVKPLYDNPALFPYHEAVGDGEDDDPLHFAPSLIDAIQATPRQEIGSHTFSHYHCLEPGQSREAFADDLKSAVRIAHMSGIQLTSFVFPKNQYNPDYEDVLIDAGITSYRSNQPGWMYKGVSETKTTTLMRAARLTDSYLNVNGPHTTRWDELCVGHGICRIPASFFLRPYSPRLKWLDPLRLHRITKSIERAARAREIVHLWWHPHNFGVHLDENIAFLRAILEGFAHQRETHGMRSLSMADVAAIVMP